MTVSAVALVLAGAPPWVLAVLVPDFLAKAVDRPAFAPLTRAAAWVVGPWLPAATRRRHTEWPPKRFAARLGLGMVVAILAFYLLAPESAVGTLFAATLGVLSALEAGVGFCVGCRVYTLLGHFHLVRACANDTCEVLPEAR